MNRTICTAAFVAGLLAVVWVGIGYIGSPLALAMTAIIGAVYLAGAAELARFHRDTAALARALGAIPNDLAHPGDWLARLPPALQNAVRLRIDGERVGLPGPALTPYLVGLLVLLGMLGTFLGMVVTLNGAVLALESTTDLHTIRAALAAPVKGLGVAFGTSVAGVAASAMLGLVSAMCRRARLHTAQLLDNRVATVLRGFSLGHQRQEAYKALQLQSQHLPELVDRMQQMMAQMEQHSRQSNERLNAEQERFYRDARGVYAELAASVDASLKDSLTASARLAGETIQPVVEATMGGIARETSALQERVADAVSRQLDGLSARFDATVATVADTWTTALARHEQSSDSLSRNLQQALAAGTDNFAQRSTALLASVDAAHAGLRAELANTTASLARDTAALHEKLAASVEAQLDGVSARFGSAVTGVADTWTSALARHEHASATLTSEMHSALQAFATTFAERSAALLASVGDAHRGLQAELAGADEARLAAQTQAVAEMAASLREEWQQAGAKAAAQQEQICRALDDTARSIAADAEARLATQTQALEAMAAALRQEWQQAGAQSAAQQAEISRALGDAARAIATEAEARLATQTQALEAMAAGLREEWQQAGARTLAQQEQICRTLGDTARSMAAEAEAQTRGTIAEVTRLMETAAEAPKAAAEVIGQLRQELSASIARDNTMLAERSRIMETLGTLLAAINHAAAEQRQAIDALVASSAAALEGASSRFAERVEAESTRMTEVAGQIGDGAAEVASLGESFGVAVQLFTDSSDKLMTALQRIEGALAKSLTRSDEQLAYYVAQAREIIDLSMMSQQQLVEDMQRAGKPAPLAGEV